jgi:ElaB/YqjD/DUF883 family membrane-anchored ribosome-binding protein
VRGTGAALADYVGARTELRDRFPHHTSDFPIGPAATPSLSDLFTGAQQQATDRNPGPAHLPLAPPVTFGVHVMVSTTQDGIRHAQAAGHSFVDGAAGAARAIGAAGEREMSNLVSDVEDLLAHVSSSIDPEIARIRSRVEDTLAATRKSISARASQLQGQATDAVRAGDRYVHTQPWQAIGIAAATGAAIGYLIARR